MYNENKVIEVTTDKKLNFIREKIKKAGNSCGYHV